ncbi:MAG: Rieske 2Fe-2S domain-containing protein, partial [Rhodospirillales bacterium]|nr:Rieske 2Fe-2S domain-containing protein [Rhodospirillales bacterium]
VFRRYWTPIAVAEQLDKPDGDPVRVRFAGADYVAFRDSDGKLGLLDELCCHRGASLALGRNEEGGLRCLYHGWKLATDGALLEAPNHPDGKLRELVKAPAYPIRQAGATIWGYFGPPEKEPPFPDYPFMSQPEEEIYTARYDLNCNYLQLIEGGFDSSHVGILHSDMARPGWKTNNFTQADDTNNPGALAVDDLNPELSMERTDFGFHYAALRKAENGAKSVRIVPFIMPSVRIIPARERMAWIFEVPRDSEHTSTYLVAHGAYTSDKVRNRHMSGVDDPNLWSEEDFKWRGSWENNFGQDRSLMNESWTGMRGLEQEDAAMTLSMGPIYDRTLEHLVAADGAVVEMRRVLLDAARGMAEGKDPLGLPSLAGVAAVVDTDIQPGGRWQDLAPGNKAAV